MLSIFLHELKSDLRSKYSIGGVLLYVLSSVYVAYLSQKGSMEPQTWVGVFWVLTLFSAVNASLKSFFSDSRGLRIYYFNMARPEAFILGKTIYNFLLITLVSFIAFATFSFLNGNPILQKSLFLLYLIPGALGLAAVLSLMAAIASKSGNSFTLLAILSFPLFIPVLLISLKLSMLAMNGLEFAAAAKYFFSLIALDSIAILLSYLLFPYLWKE